MAGFPFSQKVYSSHENQYNPYEFTSNSYGNFSENCCIPPFYDCSENNYNPYEFTPNSYGNFYENNYINKFSTSNEQNFNCEKSSLEDALEKLQAAAEASEQTFKHLIEISKQHCKSINPAIF